MVLRVAVNHFIGVRTPVPEPTRRESGGCDFQPVTLNAYDKRQPEAGLLLLTKRMMGSAEIMEALPLVWYLVLKTSAGSKKPHAGSNPAASSKYGGGPYRLRSAGW